MAAPIVIDVGVAEPQRELATVLVDACSQAAASSGSDCRLVSDAPSGPYTAIAIVTWEEGDRARVEVGVRRKPTSEWRTRELAFQPADLELERYRSVGFVIGSLATAAHDDSATPAAEPLPDSASKGGTSRPPPAKPKETKTRQEPAPAPLTRPRASRGSSSSEPADDDEPPSPALPRGPKRGWVGVFGLLGGGLDRGTVRYGGGLGLGVRFVPHLAAVASGSASTRARDAAGVVPEWLDAGLGLMLEIGPAAFVHGEVRGQAMVEYFRSVATVDSRTGESKRVALGGRFGLDAVLPLGQMLDIVVGGDLFLRPATIVRVRGHRDAATRNAELGLTAGLRVEL